ncbi:polysialyltransferase family glycosyltransferase [Salinimicrobium sp. GXAS 041]|uniref:polysialyltransferase family glycosyltransferase n=1 Tax=Salinimicrobium sp. GXAS 041 TaxID=3400806 RepID=UPI003C7645D4
MAYSLVLISTPSQAFFLSRTPEVSQNAILIITVKTQGEASKIQKYLEGFSWKKVYIWLVPQAEDRRVYYKLFLLKLKLFRLKYKYSTLNSIYFGSYANIIQLSIVAEFEHKASIILLYDGLQLVSVNYFRNKLSTENKKKFPRAYNLLGFKQPEIDQIIYISPLKLKAGGRDRIRILKREKISKPQILDENLIFYIGQPLSNVGMISSEYYINTLKKLNNNTSKKIIYFPHPRENKEIVAEVSKIFEIKVPEVIFEDYYLHLRIVPKEIISMYSSVLVNMIFLNAPSNLTAIEIPKNEINGSRFIKLVAPIYEYFHHISNYRFQVINSTQL